MKTNAQRLNLLTLACVVFTLTGCGLSEGCRSSLSSRYCAEDSTALSGPFGGGSGTSDDPYRICTPEHLQAIGDDEDHLHASFALHSDLDMKDVENFQPIAGGIRRDARDEPNEYTEFSGQFFGRHFAIKNLRIHDADPMTPIGLFGHIGRDGRVDGVILQNVKLHDGRKAREDAHLYGVGGLAGINEGQIVDTALEGTVEGAMSTGGLVGINEGKMQTTFAYADVTGDDWATGGLVGTNNGTILESGAVHPTESWGGPEGTNQPGLLMRLNDLDYHPSVSGEDVVGGLVGLNRGTVTRSWSTADVTAQTSHAGGLVGINYGQIMTSLTRGDVEGDHRVGGLAGYSNGTVSGSKSSGHVQGTLEVGGAVGFNTLLADKVVATGSVEGTEKVGGAVGKNTWEFTRSVARGDVRGEIYVGGFAGSNSNEVAISAAEGPVEGDRFVGGLVGINDGRVTDALALGDVSGHSYVGGLAGRHGWTNNGDRRQIRRCYVTGEVRGDDDVGAIVGQSKGRVENSYWNESWSGVDRSDGGKPMETARFGDPASFRSWDFQKVWTIDDNAVTPRPVLRLELQ